MAKRRRGYMTVEVDLGQALEEIDDDTLLQEVDDRKLTSLSEFDPVDDLQDMRMELLRGRSAEALAILDRLLTPKWTNAKACEIAMKKATAARLEQVKSSS